MIIFISFFVLTLIITSMTIRSENTKKQSIAENTANYITEYLVSEFSSSFIPMDFERFVALKINDISTMINILSKNAEKMTILITDPKGNILVSTDNAYSGSITDQRVLTALTDKKESKFYTDINGLMDRKYGVMITPFQYTHADISAGALIVCYSAGTPNDLAIGTVRTIILASMWVMIASFVVIYFITEKIVAPIK
jgi:hypothetical protein